MGIKFTEEQLREMLKNNPALKVASSIGGDKPLENIIPPQKISVKKEKKTKIEKISLQLNSLDINESSDKSKTKKSSGGIKVSDINKLNKEAIISYSSSEEHFSILFIGAKLLSVNQIFAILQYRKYEIFNYKKLWHELIKKALEEASLELKSQKKDLPFFDDSVEITLFRQATRLVDEDAMSTMFKFIIDGLKRDGEKNPLGILAEDNPKIVHRIVCYSEKGDPAIGIKVKRIVEKKKKFSAKDILDNE